VAANHSLKGYVVEVSFMLGSISHLGEIADTATGPQWAMSNLLHGSWSTTSD